MEFRRDNGDSEAFFGSAGARLLHASSFTPAVQAFLRDEEVALREILAQGVEHLIVIGCGDGLHRALASDLGLHYDGIDLIPPGVPPAADRGELRSRIHTAAAEELDGLLSQGHLVVPGERALFCLPFNVLGNLTHPERFFRAAAPIGAAIFVSVFTVDAVEARRAYYERCGLTGLREQRNARGSLFTSAEGLQSYAYEPDYIAEMLASEGLTPLREWHHGFVGKGLLFGVDSAR